MALDVGSLNEYGQAERIATATNGKYYFGINPSQIVTDIQNAIITSFDTYSTVTLGTSAGARRPEGQCFPAVLYGRI